MLNQGTACHSTGRQVRTWTTVEGRPLDHIWRMAKIQARAWDRDCGWMPWSRTQGPTVAEMAEEATGKSSGGGASGLFIYLNKKSETKPFNTTGTDHVLAISQLLPDHLHHPTHPSSCSLS